MKQSTFCWLIRLYFWSLIILLAVFVKPPYDFMAFNTFLGYLPIELGIFLRHFNDRRALAFWVLLVVWLLFYPNAPMFRPTSSTSPGSIPTPTSPESLKPTR